MSPQQFCADGRLDDRIIYPLYRGQDETGPFACSTGTSGGASRPFGLGPRKTRGAGPDGVQSLQARRRGWTAALALDRELCARAGGGGHRLGRGGVPGPGDEPVYALPISDDSVEPTCRAGDRIIVAPGAEVNAGDGVVARTVGGEIMAKVLARRNARTVELASLNPDYRVGCFRPGEIAWIARILWASQ